MTTITQLENIEDAIFEALQESADDDWNHPAAAKARKLTADAGMTWNFINWSHAASMIHDEIAELEFNAIRTRTA